MADIIAIIEHVHKRARLDVKVEFDRGARLVAYDCIRSDVEYGGDERDGGVRQAHVRAIVPLCLVFCASAMSAGSFSDTSESVENTSAPAFNPTTTITSSKATASCTASCNSVCAGSFRYPPKRKPPRDSNANGPTKLVDAEGEAYSIRMS